MYKLEGNEYLYHLGITRVARVAHYFLVSFLGGIRRQKPTTETIFMCDGIHYRVAQGKL
jgi:hypothetical protein